jgi:hypothetical protein
VEVWGKQNMNSMNNFLNPIYPNHIHSAFSTRKNLTMNLTAFSALKSRLPVRPVAPFEVV